MSIPTFPHTQIPSKNKIPRKLIRGSLQRNKYFMLREKVNQAFKLKYELIRLFPC